MLDELIAAARVEMLTACNTEFSQPDGAQRLVRRLTKFFDDVARLLEFDACDAGEVASGHSPPRRDDRIIGASTAMSRVRIAINRLAQRSRAPVLILGEAGTGRRHCARALHLETYPDGEFFELEDPARLSELDRHLATVRAQASTNPAGGSTVYVRNLFDCPPPIQEKVGQLTGARGLPLRIVASSKRRLPAHAARQCLDLLQAFPNELRLPPLVEREADVCELARHFSQRASQRTRLAAVRFSDAALARMQEHAWPANVAELSALVDRVSRDRAGKLVHDSDLAELHGGPSGVAFRLPPTGLDFAMLERELLSQALAIAGNNQPRAAALLGLSRDQYRYRLAKFEFGAFAAK